MRLEDASGIAELNSDGNLSVEPRMNSSGDPARSDELNVKLNFLFLSIFIALWGKFSEFKSLAEVDYENWEDTQILKIKN